MMSDYICMTRFSYPGWVLFHRSIFHSTDTPIVSSVYQKRTFDIHSHWDILCCYHLKPSQSCIVCSVFLNLAPVYKYTMSSNKFYYSALQWFLPEEQCYSAISPLV